MRTPTLILAASLTLACSDSHGSAETHTQPEPPTPAAPTAAPTGEPQPAEPVTDEPSPEALPMPEDFEEEVASAITDENYEAELRALEEALAEAE